MVACATAQFYGFTRGDTAMLKAFKQFKTEHQKTYPTSLEEYNRFQTFKSNWERIQALNERHPSARFGVNKFTDLTEEEFASQYLGYKKAAVDVTSVLPEMELDLPASVDWTTKGAVTPVKDQGQCGSCWAFSVTEAIESVWYLANHPLVSLSPQQIVDCDQGRGDLGCSGGDTPTAYAYVMAAGGMETDQDYPYQAADDTCQFQSSKVVAKISSWAYVTTTKNETQMMATVAAKAPLSVCVEADVWQFYIGGVLTTACGNALDHCVQITGYGQKAGWDTFNYDVWFVRNSWGADWGESGYIWIQRGSDLCGIADEVTLPIV